MASAVFAIPELLESILVRLDEKTLLEATVVSKTFLNSINTSQKIKQRLCLQPYDKILAYPFNGYFVPEIHFNQLLFDQRDVAIDNPVRPARLLLSEQGGIQIRFIARLGFETVAQSASCRDMLLFHPPVKVIQIFVNYQPSPATPDDERLGIRVKRDWYIADDMLRSDNGVRFGQILSFIESLGIEGKVQIRCDLEVQFDDDEDDFNSAFANSWPTFTEENDVPKKKLQEVSVDDTKLARINVMIDVTQTKGLVPATFTPPKSLIQGMFGKG